MLIASSNKPNPDPDLSFMTPAIARLAVRDHDKLNKCWVFSQIFVVSGKVKLLFQANSNASLILTLLPVTISICQN